MRTKPNPASVIRCIRKPMPVLPAYRRMINPPPTCQYLSEKSSILSSGMCNCDVHKLSRHLHIHFYMSVQTKKQEDKAISFPETEMASGFPACSEISSMERKALGGTDRSGISNRLHPARMNRAVPRTRTAVFPAMLPGCPEPRRTRRCGMRL